MNNDMNNRELEKALRATFAGRAEQITSGPDWHAASTSESHKPRYRRARWLAPLAATAVVAGIAGGLLAFHGNGDGHPAANRPPTTSPDAPPVPAGMRPVSALGIEIFVPASMDVDQPCGTGVSRPIARPMAWASLDCARGPAVAIERAPVDPGASTPPCIETIVLDGEPGCVREFTPEGRAEPTQTYGAWPLHDVAVVVNSAGADALRIIRSVHATPVDRDGCAARDEALLLPRNLPDPANVRFATGVPRDEPAEQMSVCWYIGNRLVASGLLGSRDAVSVLRGAQTVGGLFTAYSGGRCDAVDRTNGVELITQYADGSTEGAVLHTARCDGRSPASPAGQYVAKLGRLAGMPLTLGHRPGD